MTTTTSREGLVLEIAASLFGYGIFEESNEKNEANIKKEIVLFIKSFDIDIPTIPDQLMDYLIGKKNLYEVKDLDFKTLSSLSRQLKRSTIMAQTAWVERLPYKDAFILSYIGKESTSYKDVLTSPLGDVISELDIVSGNINACSPFGNKLLDAFAIDKPLGCERGKELPILYLCASNILFGKRKIEESNVNLDDLHSSTSGIYFSKHLLSKMNEMGLRYTGCINKKCLKFQTKLNNDLVDVIMFDTPANCNSSTAVRRIFGENTPTEIRNDNVDNRRIDINRIWIICLKPIFTESITTTTADDDDTSNGFNEMSSASDLVKMGNAIFSTYWETLQSLVIRDKSLSNITVDTTQLRFTVSESKQRWIYRIVGRDDTIGPKLYCLKPIPLSYHEQLPYVYNKPIMPHLSALVDFMRVLWTSGTKTMSMKIKKLKRITPSTSADHLTNNHEVFDVLVSKLLDISETYRIIVIYTPILAEIADTCTEPSLKYITEDTQIFDYTNVIERDDADDRIISDTATYDGSLKTNLNFDYRKDAISFCYSIKPKASKSIENSSLLNRTRFCFARIYYPSEDIRIRKIRTTKNNKNWDRVSDQWKRFLSVMDNKDSFGFLTSSVFIRILNNAIFLTKNVLQYPVKILGGDVTGRRVLYCSVFDDEPPPSNDISPDIVNVDDIINIRYTKPYIPLRIIPFFLVSDHRLLFVTKENKLVDPPREPIKLEGAPPPPSTGTSKSLVNALEKHYKDVFEIMSIATYGNAAVLMVRHKSSSKEYYFVCRRDDIPNTETTPVWESSNMLRVYDSVYNFVRKTNVS